MIREWIERAAAERGQAVYLEDAGGNGALTYAALADVVRAWEETLEQARLKPGARVAVRMPEPLGYATALVGLLGAGRVAVPLDPSAPAAELERMLAVAGPEAVIAGSAAGLPPGLELLPPPAAGLSRGRSSPAGQVLAGEGGIYLCSSGTTGTPKGILLDDDQLGHVAAGIAAHHRLTPSERGYCSLPLFHVNAEVVGLLATLSAGACLVLDGKFSRRGFWETIAEQEITWINAVPAIITILAMDPPPRAAAGRVRFVRSASAPLPKAALERFEDGLGIPVVETYGMTEAASMITANPLDGPRKAGSAGLPVGVQLRVVRGTGEPCVAGSVGRVQIRGRGVISEYADNGRPGAIDADGWLDTGDLGYLDADGYLFLAGRSDDVINRGGEKIYPREIEEVLIAQPGVKTAAVVGVTDEVLGERPVAYVVPDGGRPGAGPGDASGAALGAALSQACLAELPRFKQPAEFRLVSELPLGPTGKVARRRLKQLAAPRRAGDRGSLARPAGNPPRYTGGVP